MDKKGKVYLYGASGHAKVVIDIAKLVHVDVPCLIDDNPELNSLVGLPVLHSAEGLSPIIVTIGNCQIRRKIVRDLGERDYLSIIHPDAILADSAKIGVGTVIMAGAILNPFVKVGNHSIVNTGALLDHDVQIGNFVHVAPHTTLCGEVHVGNGTWIGAGTTVIQGIHIGKDCFIGAGSVVVKDIPDNTLSFGNPSRIIRKIYEGTENQEDC
jgi:sugar O-acyltransferase (sialic acid O-acetyltransferase NeuD family)